MSLSSRMMTYHDIITIPLFGIDIEYGERYVRGRAAVGVRHRRLDI